MEIISGIGEKEEVSKVKDEVKKLDDARDLLKRQMLVNVMFLYGRHHFTLHKKAGVEDNLVQRITWELESLRKSNTVRRTSNYILPLFRSVYSRLIRMKANVHADPTTSTDSDRDAARVSKEVAEEFWQNCNRNNPWLSEKFSGMQAVMMRLILYKMTLGAGYLIPYFNPKAKSFVYDQQANDIIEADVGEAEVRVASAMNIFRDYFGRHTIERRLLCPEQIEYEFDAKVEPKPVDDTSIEMQIGRLLEGSKFEDIHKDGAYIYSKYCVPDAKYPDGRMLVCSDDKVLFDGKLPSEYKKRPVAIEFLYQDLGFASTGQGAVEQVVDLQQDYNFTINRIHQYKKLLTGKVMAPKGAKLSAKWDDEVGQILYYQQGFKPTYEDGAQVPAYLFEELSRIRSDMENLMNSHDVSMGRTPGQVKSGVGIENLSERDDAQIAPELIMFEQKLGYFMETELDICQERYNERRLLSISGDNMAYEIKSFIGSDLFGHKRVKVALGSGLPTNKSERQAYIMNLQAKGYISIERAKELLEFGDIDGLYHGLDETATKQDILNVIEGSMTVQAEPWEDHTIALKVINDFRKSTKYAKLPMQLRAGIDMLAQQHEDMLLNEQAAAGRMGAPLPPAATPQPPNGGK